MTQAISVFHNSQPVQFSVSQYDKNQFPTLKTATSLGLIVGRHNKKPLTRTHAQEKKAFYKAESQNRILLIENYIEHINFFNAELFVDCGFKKYQTSIFTAAPLAYRNLFYDLVCALTKVNKTYRELANGKLLADASDYIEAIKLITWATEPLEKCNTTCYKNVLRVITEKYNQTAFKAIQIASRTGYKAETVRTVLNQLLKENVVEKISGQTWCGRAYKPCLFFKYKVNY